jgi:tripartite-type tricarboxylate transporter receptor subunit TctC
MGAADGSGAQLVKALLLCALCAPALALAQGSYPSKPIRFVVPQTPGGQVDTVGRSVAQQLGERLGQPVVIENRAGANGAIGSEHVARSVPDGYTLLMSNQSSLVFNAVTRKSLPYDPVTDFGSITLLFDTPYYLIVHPSVPAKSVQELIALARSQPGKLNFGTVGVGSGQHLFTETFKARTKIDIVHVPYKGSTQVGADILAGQIQLMLQGSGFTVPQAKTGKIRVLASSGAKRTVAMPDVPTIAESGIAGYTASTWYGLSGPAKLPRSIVDRLNRDVGEILRSAALREKFEPVDIVLAPSTPEELTERVRTEIPLFAKAMKDAGVEPE